MVITSSNYDDMISVCLMCLMVIMSSNYDDITPVLNVGQDIVRYLLFTCCCYEMEKSFAISFAAKNGRYL